MIWIWLSLVILIVVAKNNAEKHQTSRDSTTGQPLPMGERGAVMADSVGLTIG